MVFRYLMIGLALASMRLDAWTGERWFEKARSPRIANYGIQATLDWREKALEGHETLTWRNTGTSTTAELPLHLYLNAFKGPRSPFFQATGARLGREAADRRLWGFCRLRSVTMDGASLEGHYGEDETVYWVRLPGPVAPGETISLDIDWTSRFPLAHSRSGWSKDFLLGAQWFPKAGVYQGDRWDCRAYHPGTGFFADFGTYNVRFSMPRDLLLAHTGTLDSAGGSRDLPADPDHPGNVLWNLHAEDVHDFAWAAMPSRGWVRRSFDYRGVMVSCFLPGGTQRAFERQRQAIQFALKHAGEWFFPYPYPVLTVVDVPPGAEGADRVEFPTLVTTSNPPFDPLRRRLQPELDTIREVGHQWFYGMLATDAAAEPWLDDGFASWFAAKAVSRGYQSLFNSRRFEVEADAPALVGYWRDPEVDPVSRPGSQTRDLQSGVRTARCKAPLVLDQLEALLGRPLMERVLQEYVREMAFRHPTGQDFRHIAEQVTGRDLADFWQDFVSGTDTLDMAILRVGSKDVYEGGWMDAPGGPVFTPPQPAAPGRTGSLTLVRRGGLRLPITIWVQLENRAEQRLTWDGQDRWATFEFDSPIAAAALDPDGNYPMLKDRLHACYTAAPVRRGLHYWSHLLWSALTGLLQGAGLG